MRSRFIIFLILLLPLVLCAQRKPTNYTSEELRNNIRQDRIVIKLKPGIQSSVSKVLEPISSARSVRPISKPSVNKRGTSKLDGIYYIDLDARSNPIDVCRKLLQNDHVLYAEVLVYEELFHTPNDPFVNQATGNQDYLQTIKAFEAWDVTTGNADVLIGIVDTGMDIDHADLVNKYFQNPNEVIDGVDNDNNGYIDDVLGYDFADNDNNPNADTDITSTLNHGTHVGGVAGAQTNNGLGVASIGYDCSIVPLKGFTTSSVLSTGVWEAVLYAADNGYDIVNLSWGNTNGYNQYYQDIIDYCVLEKDMVIIAAAGNTNDDIDFYPASYDHVISVAASTLSDNKWSSGTYSDHVDIMAPGVSIYSTQKDDSYGSDSGSSHASPLVAGVAGLVKSAFPEYNAMQVMEQIRVTSDDIYSVSGNESFEYKLGKGRLNAYRAVTETATKSLRVHNLEFSNGHGPYAFYGDTVSLTFDLTNYLNKVESPRVFLESDSPYITIFNNEFEPGLMQPMETVSGSSFTVVLDDNTPASTEINLRFFMEDESYADFQNVSFFTSPDFLDVTSENLSLTVAGNGDIGRTDTYTQGNGLNFQEAQIGQYHGFMMGNSSSVLYDNVPSFFYPAANDGDFIGLKTIKYYNNQAVGTIAYSEYRTWDNDFLIEQTLIPGTTDDFVILEYRVVNKSGFDAPNFFFGFFSDQDITGGANSCEWSAINEAMIFEDESGGILGALATTQDSPEFVALNMQDFNGHTQDVDDNFTNTEKFSFLSGGNINRAGELAGGNDVAGLVKTSIANFSNNSEFRIAFILTAAESTPALTSNLSAARGTYESFLNNPETSEVFFSCEGGEVILNPQGTNFDFFEDALGEILIESGTSLLVNNIDKDTAIYVQNRDNGYPSRLSKVDIKILQDIALFEPSTDTLYLDNPSLNAITFNDQSFEATSWVWDFGNGNQSTVQNPTINYSSTGSYTVSLSVESALGCEDTFEKEIVVANRPSSPTLDDFSICSSETIELNHPSDEFAIYDNKGIRQTKGNFITLGPFYQDSTLRIANKINGFESLPVSVNVIVDPIASTFEIYPDTLSTETSALFRFTGSNANSFNWTIDGSPISSQSEFTSTVNTIFDVELTVANDNCSDLNNQMISLSASGIPSQNDLQVCQGESVAIQPGNGTYFGFYNDPELTQLIKKGKQLTIENLISNQKVYIVGLDGIIPSNAIEVSIETLEFSTSIEATPPSLDLTTGSSVQFSANQISSARWYVDDELVETSLNPILLFSEPGIYTIRLEAENILGCSIVESIQYEVRGLVTSISKPEDLIVYPNPSDGIVKIVSGTKLQQITIYDLSGQVIMERLNVSKNSFDLKLGSGVYLLEIVTPVTTNLKKLIIR